MMITFAILLAMLHGTCGFYPNRLTEFKLTADTYTHEDITEIGILKAVAAYFEDHPRPERNFTPGELSDMEDISAQKLFTQYYGANLTGQRLNGVITSIVTTNNDVYKDFFGKAVWHFNGEQIKEANDKLISIREEIIDALMKQEDDSTDDNAVKLIGKYLHIMQMFYSNTNWVEMFGSDAYYNLGILGKPIYAQANLQPMTCKSCGDLVGRDCNDTLLIGNGLLTSGYFSRQDVVKPPSDPKKYTTGKCSHGGLSDETGATVAALGGINKDSDLPEFSPHYFLHRQAAHAAINHTTFFFNDKVYGIRHIIGEEKFRRFCQLKSGQSLAFVIDYSGSMAGDISTVKTQIIKIINSLVDTINEPSDYIIVLFNDPENLTRSFQTESSQDAREYVANITVDGGEDCPEYAMTGIETALTLSKFNSRVLIFTDAPAKDSSKAPFVEKLALVKNILLTFLLRITCGVRRRRGTNRQPGSGMYRSRRSTDGEDLYRSLAAATGGSVYVTDKAGISKLANIITETGTTSSATIFKREMTAGSGDINFNVDNTISVLIIEITGSSLPNEKIYNQRGNLVTSGLNVTDLGIGKIIKIKDPSPGVWRLSGLNSASWLVDISAISTLDISTMFVQYDPSTKFEYQIKGRPVAGEEATIIVTVPAASLITSLDSITLLSDDGSVLAQHSNMTRIDSRADTSLFRAKFELPVKAFKVEVSGRDTGGNVFTRLQTKMIVPVAIQLDLLPVDDSFYINEALTVKCNVINKGDSQTVINVTVEDDKGFAQEPRTQTLTLDPDQSQIKQFIFRAGPSPGVVTTVTITAKAGSTGEQFVVMRLATEERVIRAEDNILPVCNITSTTGTCDETMVDPCVCSQYNWTATAEIWDEGFGLYQITSSVTFTHDNFPEGYTKAKGTVMGKAFGNCCNPNAYIAVVDLASNTGQCDLNLAPDVVNIPTECIQDLIDPVCNITSTTGICNETMVDPCVCSQYNWTATAEIWDEGFGLSQISSSVEKARFAHEPFDQGHNAEDGVLIAKVGGNCCSPLASITVVDLARNNGRCTLNLAPGLIVADHDCIPSVNSEDVELGKGETGGSVLIVIAAVAGSVGVVVIGIVVAVICIVCKSRNSK